MPSTIGFATHVATVAPPAADHPVKLAGAFAPLIADIPNYTAGSSLTAATWASVAGYYDELHYEGHNWSRLRDTGDGVFQTAKFRTGGGGRTSGYVNGSSVTQGSPWTPVYAAAHMERHHPLGIAMLVATGFTLNTGITNIAQTLKFNLPTTVPAGLPAAHPNGTPSSLWPIIGSTLTPTTTTYSRNTAEYVSVIRMADEIIGLPVYSAGVYTVAAGVLTITGCIRGMWGTTAGGRSAGVQVYVPDYVGSANADPSDVGLTGNPYANSTAAPIRYQAATWDSARGTLHDAVAVIADQARAELLGWALGAVKVVTAVNAGTNTLTSVAHGLITGDRVMLGGYDIPTGIRSLTPYYVVGGTTDTFQLSLTSGGAAIALGTTAVGGLKVALLRATEAVPAFDTVWWDVTSGKPYNHADAYGRDAVTEPAWVSMPWDFTNPPAQRSWITRQNEKKAQLSTKLGVYNFGTLYHHANSYIAQQAADVPERLGWMADNIWDGYALERYGQTAARIDYELDQLMGSMTGKDETGAVVNAAGHRVICWVKVNDYQAGSIDSTTTKDRYIRRAYGMWLLCWREAATAAKLLIKSYVTSLGERPSDTIGAELFSWDLGVPTTQLGSKPTNPASVADLHQPTPGLYRRDYTKGTVLVNTTAGALTITADRAYYDTRTELGGNGQLTKRLAGSTITIPAYDSLILLLPVTTTPPPPPPTGTNMQFDEGTWLLFQPGSLSNLNSKATVFQTYLSLDGVKGLILRVPSTLLYPNATTQAWDSALPDAGLAIAAAVGKKFMIWPMSGRYTPQWALESRFHTIVAGGVTYQIPTPFMPASDGLASTPGVPGNPAFVAWFTQLCTDAAAWSRANGCRSMRLPWYGRLWNEFDNDDIQALSGYGTTNANFQASHKELVQIGLAVSGADLMVGWPQSGHPNAGPGTPQANIHEVFTYGSTLVGQYSDRGPISSANGWGGAGVSATTGSVPSTPSNGSDTRIGSPTLSCAQAWAQQLQYPTYTYDGLPVTTGAKSMYGIARTNRWRHLEFYEQAFQRALAGNATAAEAALLDAMPAHDVWLAANPNLVAM